jgi:hypothetical protein
MQVLGGEQARGARGVTWAWLAAALALLLAMWSAPRAEALVYWADEESNTIARANLNGGGVDQDFLDIPDLSPSYGLASSGAHVFWATESGAEQGDIGRASVTGAGIDLDFISLASPSFWSTAVAGQHVYWLNENDAIGRARLDGTQVRESFIPGIGNSRGLGVSRTHAYWGNGAGAIGRAKLDGTGVDPGFIPVDCAPDFVAVSTKHVYWSDGCDDTIGRARLNGAGVNENFITGAGEPTGVAVFGSHVYWSNFEFSFNDGTIGRAKLDGSRVDHNFIAAGDSNPRGLAVDWIANRGSAFRFGKVALNRRRGTAALAVNVPGPGKLRLTGRSVKRISSAARAARAKLAIKPKGALADRLRADGRATVTVRVRFAPKLSTGSKTKRKRVTLRRG